MSRAGADRPILVTLLILAATFGSTGVRAAAPPVLEGTVRDSLGNVLAGVELLFVEIPATGFAPAATTTSGREGRFRVERLLPGRYRIAALKQGYRTFIGQINTALQESVELVLQPAVELDARELPRDPAWALRLPRRGILHELEGNATGVESAAAQDDLSVEIEQHFALNAAAAESRPEDTEINASRTGLALASTLGANGNLRLRGHQERLGTEAAPAEGAGSASRRAAAVSLDMAYETGDESQLAMTAHFNETDYGLVSGEVDARSLRQQNQRSWGYDASWTKRLDPDSQVAVAVGVVDASLAATSTVSNRTVGAEGSYAATMSDRHELQVALRAQLLRAPSSPYHGNPYDAAGAYGSAWSIQADAQDTWSVSSPVALVYGLGYKQAFVVGESTLVVPRLGGSLEAGGWQARAIVSYHSVTGERTETIAPEPAALRPARRFGYEAELEIPLAEEIHLRGGSRYMPIQFGYFGYLAGVTVGDEHPLYLTDGNAAVEEHRLVLSEERGPSQTYLELSDGFADGAVMPLLPFDGPVAITDGRELRYRNGRLGVVLPNSGTDLRVEYLRLQAGTVRGGRPASLQESVEFRVRQMISRRQLPGDWRLLLALRLGSIQSDELEAWGEGEASETASALNRRISAGVSVLF